MTQINKQERIKELEQKIVAVCLRCPKAKVFHGIFLCRQSRRLCHSVKVGHWLDEIKKLEDVEDGTR